MDSLVRIYEMDGEVMVVICQILGTSNARDLNLSFTNLSGVNWEGNPYDESHYSIECSSFKAAHIQWRFKGNDNVVVVIEGH